jgi:molecular chaperone HtpG
MVTILEVKIDKEGKTAHYRSKVWLLRWKIHQSTSFLWCWRILEKYKDTAKDSGIIGHFGLGFYSAFMVASKVEIITKSYKTEPAAHWICDGSPNSH